VAVALLNRTGKAVIAGLAGAAYAHAILARNDRLRPSPIHDTEGVPLPGGTFRFSDGEEVAYVDAGQGSTILWVAGADGVKETWRYQLPSFAERHRVVAADLRVGIGPTDRFDRFVTDLVELINGLDTGPVTLVGQSLGSAIAMRFASRFPELLHGLVLCNPVARITYEHVGLNSVALVPLARWTTRYLPTPIARALAHLWCRSSVWIYDDSPGRQNLVDYALWTGPRTVRAHVSGRRVYLLKGMDLRLGLRSVATPTLVIKGAEDTYCPTEWALEIAGMIPGARYLTIPETGHCCHISMPGTFNRALRNWLSETEQAKEGCG
jgi:pimeloyl-ACP methyl ester carboxylesterase